MSMPSSKPCWKSLSSLDSSCPSSKPRNCFFWDFHFPSTVFLIGQDEVLLVSKSGCQGLPRWLGGKESAYLCRRCRRHGFNPWVGKIPWRRAWQPTPVFLSGRSHGPRSLSGCSPWGRKELNTTEGLSLWTRSGCHWPLSPRGLHLTFSDGSLRSLPLVWSETGPYSLSESMN